MVSLSNASLAILAKADAYKQNTKTSVQTVQAKAVPVKAITTKINTVQTNLSSIGLGEKTLAAQKALAEKYGITTFDVKGNISQVPTTRPIDPTINVGTGILTNSSYNDSIKILVQQEQAKTTSGNSGIGSGIITGITDFFDSFFNTGTLNDIPEDVQKQLDDIDIQIADAKKAIDDENTRYNIEIAGQEGHAAFNIASLHQTSLNAINAILLARQKKRERILFDYKTQKEFLPKVQSLIDSLNLYGKIDTLTPQLKTEIQDRIAQASALLEKIIGENLSIARSKISELQHAMLLAANVMELPVTAIQTTVNSNMDGTAEVLDIFNLLNPSKSVTDRAKDIIFEYRAQREAITVLLQTGEFNK